ncbi:MAG TPA: YtxH domain-containing protein [Vicinamibacterales bacterium]|jgi:hypothetical protein|nr:YtxH domain-containing protein [Vicinamibacterales bacterium]
MTLGSSWTGAVVGASVGALIGYLYFTADGRRRRDEIGGALDRMVVEIDELRRLWLRLGRISDEYRQARTSPVARSSVFEVKPGGGAA